jgi:hypothetical protein
MTMVWITKALRVGAMCCLVWLGVSWNPSEVKAAERDYICAAQYHVAGENIPKEAGGGSGGTYGWTEVTFSTSSCNLATGRKIYYCSTGATAGVCQKSGHDQLNSVALVQYFQRAYSAAISTAMQAKYSKCACRNDPKGVVNCPNPIRVAFEPYSP